jgi:hypothetical protein
MKELIGQFLLERLYCPGCGALFNTELVEEQENAQKERSKSAEA